MTPTMASQTKAITLHLTADPNLQVRHQIRNGDEVQLHPTKLIRFRSEHSFSLLMSPFSPFIDGANPVHAVLKGTEWLVEAEFRPDAANAAPAYNVAINQTTMMAAAHPQALAAAAVPQVEIIIEQY